MNQGWIGLEWLVNQSTNLWATSTRSTLRVLNGEEHAWKKYFLTNHTLLRKDGLTQKIVENAIFSPLILKTEESIR